MRPEQVAGGEVDDAKVAHLQARSARRVSDVSEPSRAHRGGAIRERPGSPVAHQVGALRPLPGARTTEDEDDLQGERPTPIDPMRLRPCAQLPVLFAK